MPPARRRTTRRRTSQSTSAPAEEASSSSAPRTRGGGGGIRRSRRLAQRRQSEDDEEEEESSSSSSSSEAETTMITEEPGFPRQEEIRMGEVHPEHDEEIDSDEFGADSESSSGGEEDSRVAIHRTQRRNGVTSSSRAWNGTSPSSSSSSSSGAEMDLEDSSEEDTFFESDEEDEEDSEEFDERQDEEILRLMDLVQSLPDDSTDEDDDYSRQLQRALQASQALRKRQELRWARKGGIRTPASLAAEEDAYVYGRDGCDVHHEAPYEMISSDDEEDSEFEYDFLDDTDEMRKWRRQRSRRGGRGEGLSWTGRCFAILGFFGFLFLLGWVIHSALLHSSGGDLKAGGPQRPQKGLTTAQLANLRAEIARDLRNLLQSDVQEQISALDLYTPGQAEELRQTLQTRIEQLLSAEKHARTKDLQSSDAELRKALAGLRKELTLNEERMRQLIQTAIQNSEQELQARLDGLEKELRKRPVTSTPSPSSPPPSGGDGLGREEVMEILSTQLSRLLQEEFHFTTPEAVRKIVTAQLEHFFRTSGVKMEALEVSGARQELEDGILQSLEERIQQWKDDSSSPGVDRAELQRLVESVVEKHISSAPPGKDEGFDSSKLTAALEKLLQQKNIPNRTELQDAIQEALQNYRKTHGGDETISRAELDQLLQKLRTEFQESPEVQREFLEKLAGLQSEVDRLDSKISEVREELFRELQTVLEIAEAAREKAEDIGQQQPKGDDGKAGQLSAEEIQDLLAVWAADRTGRIDWALYQAGGVVLSGSPTYNPPFGVDPGKQEGLADASSPPPPRGTSFLVGLLRNPSPEPVDRNMVLQPVVDVGRCWPMQRQQTSHDGGDGGSGQEGWLLIELARPVQITAVTYEHPPISTTPNPNTAPKHLRFYGVPDSVVESLGPNEEPREEDLEFLIGFDFLHNQKYLQTEEIQKPDDHGVFRYVKVGVDSGQGPAPYTCLYRIRVHGTPL